MAFLDPFESNGLRKSRSNSSMILKRVASNLSSTFEEEHRGPPSEGVSGYKEEGGIETPHGSVYHEHVQGHGHGHGHGHHGGATNAKESLVMCMSALYGKLLVVIGMGFPIAKGLSHDLPLIFYNSFYLYLYFGSILFVIYSYVSLLSSFTMQLEKLCFYMKKLKASMKPYTDSFLSTVSDLKNRFKGPSKKNLNDDNPEAYKSEYRCSIVSVDMQGINQGCVADEKPSKFVYTENAGHGSMYLKMGTIVFGIGSMIYSGLEFGHYFELRADCSDILMAITPASRMVFTFLQMYFIFLNSRVSINRHTIIARFGLMHMVATNLCIWLNVLVEETKHTIHLLHEQGTDAHGGQAAGHGGQAAGHGGQAAGHGSQTASNGHETGHGSQAAGHGSQVASHINETDHGSQASHGGEAGHGSQASHGGEIGHAIGAGHGSQASHGGEIGHAIGAGHGSPINHTLPDIHASPSLHESFGNHTIPDIHETPANHGSSDIHESPNDHGIHLGIPDHDDSGEDDDHHDDDHDDDSLLHSIPAESIFNHENMTFGSDLLGGEGSDEMLFPHEETFSPFNSTTFGDMDFFNMTSIISTTTTTESPDDFSIKLFDGLFDAQGGYHNLVRRSAGDEEEGCRVINLMGDMVNSSASFLFPCTIEYSLLCASVLYAMWKNVQTGNSKIPQERVQEQQLSQFIARKVRHLYSVDCGRASRGLFSGIFILVCTLISLIIFYVLVSEPRFKYYGVLSANVSEILIYSVGIVTTIIGMKQLRQLGFFDEDETELDNVLLVIAQAGLYMFTIFTLIGGYFSSTDLPALPLISALLNLIQGTLQTLFILDGSKRCCKTADQLDKKYGREMVTFLLTINLAMWLFSTFQTSRPYLHKAQQQFYGVWAWTIINHVSMPLAIFFRFHATVCLGEIWKRAYKIKNEE